MSDRIARMMRLASDEASEVRAKAEADAAEMTSIAEQDGARLRGHYESLIAELEDRRNAMETMHEQTMAQARTEAARIVEAAQAERKAEADANLFRNEIGTIRPLNAPPQMSATSPGAGPPGASATASAKVRTDAAVIAPMMMSMYRNERTENTAPRRTSVSRRHTHTANTCKVRMPAAKITMNTIRPGAGVPASARSFHTNGSMTSWTNSDPASDSAITTLSTAMVTPCMTLPPVSRWKSIVKQ